MSAGLTPTKHALREQVRNSRRNRSAHDRETAQQQIADRLLSLTIAHRATAVSCYLSTPTEPGTRTFIAQALARGIRMLLPHSRADGLLEWSWTTSLDNALRPGLYGIDEPANPGTAPGVLTEVDLIIVPAAAVDAYGTRLGWGRGYFDRALTARENDVPVYAVVFDDEVLSHVPAEPHDHAVTGIVTPRRTLTVAPR
ncbi:5-formyltetrahydrofolate cyclo-ligase [Microbacterium sp. YY-01]|uniref:5-formyltetrahydrofolate cyclo-ligase n=1 Tax=Microbacterium sp. YY-01 TaxID=3421634 RepID=UPI003D16B002